MMFQSAASYAIAVALVLGCGSPPDRAIVVDAGPADAAPEFDSGPPARADITVFQERMLADIAEEDRNFEINSCELDPEENCIGAAGVRRLLRFSVETPNIGDTDLFLGSPSADNDDYVFSSCHGHFHFLGYASYRLVDDAGADVATAQKQAFCLVDSRPFVDDAEVSQTARFSCVFQGIQRGWSDVYGSELPCQYIDITDVAPGDYTLMVDINTEGRLDESDLENNHAEISVTVGNPDHDTPTEACDTTLPPLAIENVSRECG